MVKMLPLKWNWQWLTNLNFSALLSQTARYRTGAILVVIAILAFQSVGIFYRAVGLTLIRDRTAAPAVQQTASAPVTAAEPADVFKVIAERNLFGTTDKTLADKQAASQTQGAQPDITSTLEVRGTVAGDAKYGFAVIEDKTQKKQRLYKVGDTISGAKVVRIMRNSVALMVNDQEKILKVPETVEKGGLPTPVAAAAAPAPAAAPGGAIVVNRSDVAESLKDMGAMLNQAQIRPYFSAGQPNGFMLSSIRSGSLYQKIGLVDGDIVQAVNNRKLTTGDDMVELYNLLKSSPNMALKVMRQGREQNFNYTFR
jgi:general secretion pathway protein C